MAVPGGGTAVPPPQIPDDEAFRRLVNCKGKRTAAPLIPKFIKKLEEIPEIALPEERPMKIALALAQRGLVGQFMGLWPSSKTTDDWIQRNWKPNLTQGVTCYPVGRGFFVFEFISEEDRDLIFRNGPYFMGTQGLYLNKWTPDFDPLVDTPKEVPVWVRLPNLPLHCWDSESLQRIGNGVGRYIDRADHRGQYNCARICVEVDLEAGLPEAVKLSVGSWTHYQKLDYEHLPFKCRNCQEHGHFQRNCPKKQTTGKEDAEGWQKVKRGKNSNNARGKDKRNQEPIKGGQPSQNVYNVHESPQKNPSPADGTVGDVDPPLGPSETISPTKRPSPDNEYIRLNSNTDTETQEEEEGEASSPKGTPEQPKRGRKSEKKRREEQASKEVAQGIQYSLPEMVHTRSGAKPGKTPKGGLPPPPNK
jgi:hypothetical protein